MSMSNNPEQHPEIQENNISSPEASTPKPRHGNQNIMQMKIFELEKWKGLLMGKQFKRDPEKDFPGQYVPVDIDIHMPENVRYIIVAESGDYDERRLSVYLNKELKVRALSFG